MARSVYNVTVTFENGQQTRVEGVTGPTVVPSSPPTLVFAGPFGTTKAIVVAGANAIITFSDPQLLADSVEDMQ